MTYWKFFGAMIGFMIVILCIMAALLPMPANASSICGAYAPIKAALAKKFEEHRIGRGLVGADMVEVYKSKAGTFTFLVTYGNGRSCIIAAGRDWEDVAEEIEGKPL